MTSYDILQLQSKAQSCLQATREYLISKTLKTNQGWGLQQFLDEIHPGSTYIGIYGTSCGITTLTACGEPPDSSIVSNFRTWLIKRQETDGGWTLVSFREKEILTTSTCYVLNALNDAGEPYSSPIIQEGMSWLQKTRNPDRGWGLYNGDQVSKTTPSAHVILTFSRYPDMLRTQVASEGINWLLRARNEDYGWGFNPTAPSHSTVGHTSLSILALLSAGYPSYSTDVQEPLEWLLENTRPDSLSTVIDVFYVHHADGTATGIHYHLPSLSLGLYALLLAGVDPLRNRVTQLVRILIAQQHPDGYWQDETTQGKIPIWASMYACLALREFVKRVDAVRETLGVRQAIVDLTEVTRHTRSELQQISERLANLEQSVSPLYSTISFLRRFRVFIFLFIAALVYVLFVLNVSVPQYLNIASGILAVILALIGIYDARRSR